MLTTAQIALIRMGFELGFELGGVIVSSFEDATDAERKAARQRAENATVGWLERHGDGLAQASLPGEADDR